MAYSSKKPYQIASKDYVQFLKQHVGPESVFEKPYLQKEYGEMNQSPNVPTVPPAVGGTGELVCVYDSSSCKITVGCYAGPGIRIIGGPEEAAAGYGDPKVIQGAIIRWAIQQDVRAIEIILDPSVARNVVEVLFVDGWGRFYTQTVDITCSELPLFYSDVSGDDGWVRDDGGFYDANSDTRAGYHSSGGCDSWHKFNNISVPSGSTITSAKLILYSWVTDSIAVDLKVYAEAADDATAPVSFAAFNALTLTTANVDWNVTEVTGQVPIECPNLAAVVQEVIDRPGWVKGNSIQIIVLDNGTVSDRIEAYDWDNWSVLGKRKPALELAWI